MNMLRSKRGLLFLFLVLHQANCCNGNAYVPLPSELVESQVESWVVKRGSSADLFTVNMKPTFACVYQWCRYRFNARYDSVGVNDSHCTCHCDKRGFSSFLPSVRKCINASMAASFAGNLARRSFSSTAREHRDIPAVTKSGTGTWDAGTWGRGDFGTQRCAGIRGRDKQIAPDFSAELVKYFFLRVKCKIIC